MKARRVIVVLKIETAKPLKDLLDRKDWSVAFWGGMDGDADAQACVHQVSVAEIEALLAEGKEGGA